MRKNLAIAAVIVGWLLVSCTNTDRVDELEAQVAQLQSDLQTATDQLATAQSDLERTQDELHSAQTVADREKECLGSIQAASIEMGQARAYLLSSQQEAPKIDDANLQCGQLLSGTAIQALNHQVATMQKATKQEHDDRIDGDKKRCDPNYSGYCVPIVSYDLDCADIGYNTVYVRPGGTDIHGFDGYDNDGVGCE